jgi:hypothetical protein
MLGICPEDLRCSDHTHTHNNAAYHIHTQHATHTYRGKCGEMTELIYLRKVSVYCGCVYQNLMGGSPHGCNPSYSGGRDQEDHSSKPPRANSSQDPILKKPFMKKGW